MLYICMYDHSLISWSTAACEIVHHNWYHCSLHSYKCSIMKSKKCYNSHFSVYFIITLHFGRMVWHVSWVGVCSIIYTYFWAVYYATAKCHSCHGNISCFSANAGRQLTIHRGKRALFSSGHAFFFLIQAKLTICFIHVMQAVTIYYYFNMIFDLFKSNKFMSSTKILWLLFMSHFIDILVSHSILSHTDCSINIIIIIMIIFWILSYERVQE